MLLLLFFSCSSPLPPPPPPVGPDTTSHDFIWEIDTLGDGNSSVLYDVAIINDTTVWAVGEIYLKDSSGQVDPTAYNIAKWNGRIWTCTRVPLKDFNSPTYGYYSLRTIQSFGSNSVWVGGAGQVVHYNGSSWGQWMLLFDRLDDTTIGGINKIWGSSAGDFYVVGDRGSITRVNGTTWQRIESGTTVDILDVWGIVNGASGVKTVLCASSFVFQETGATIIRIDDDLHADTVAWGTGRRVSSVWFDDQSKLIAGGGGVFVRNSDEVWNEVRELPLTYTRRARGSSKNDVFVVGDFGFIAHFNGTNWHYYTDHETPGFYGSWMSVAVRANLVVGVGLIGDRAGVIIGRRR